MDGGHATSSVRSPFVIPRRAKPFALLTTDGASGEQASMTRVSYSLSGSVFEHVQTLAECRSMEHDLNHAWNCLCPSGRHWPELGLSISSPCIENSKAEDSEGLWALLTALREHADQRRETKALSHVG